MKKYRSQFEMMTQQPVPSLIVKLGIPTMISMFVTSIYNMADSYFVGQINTSASGKHHQQKAGTKRSRERA